MIKSVLAVAVLSAVLCACATLPSKEHEACEVSNASSTVTAGKIHSINGFELWLPLGSSLVEENTVDADYWVWSTEVGTVSMMWVGEIGRESIVESSARVLCAVQGSSLGFRVLRRGDGFVAVSDPILGSGAGVVVEIQAKKGGSGTAVAMEILRSIASVSRVE